MKHVITAAAIKGGTGKTATAGALAQAAAAAGQRVLAIDLDPQASLSIWLNANLARPGSYALLSGRKTEECIQYTDSGIDVISGTADLNAIKTAPGSAQRLNYALDSVKKRYDFAVIDTAPAMGELQNNALFASTGLIIPLEADASSVQAFYQILDIAERIRQTKPALKILGVIITKFDSRPNINRFMRDTIKEKCTAAHVPYLMEIRNGIAVREAMALQESLFEYAPKSKPAADYETLYKKIAGKK